MRHASIYGNKQFGVAKRNIAVVEYFDPSTKSLRTVTKFSRDGVHAERRAIEVIQQRLGKQGAAQNIRRVHSELSPCGPGYKNCGSFINQNAPNARVTFDGLHPEQVHQHMLHNLDLQDAVNDGFLRR
ncbi:nucleic acid/nucleotide deaminase domain-containing protein [Rhodopirellula sp. SWK7]|uniref:nucleic acid/nucleotide deaminase domain-containing protein n=1 Tax=Rhodopirellula sp. SWK7 TaxID=595460 RepID=UPI0009FDBABE